MAARLASLSSGLLARPGQAKPAMRPQGYAHQPLEDLGWNDMGQAAVPVAAPVPVPEPVAVPPVLTQRAALSAAVARPAAPAPAKPKPATAPKSKAAFTLRLDPARHLRLRLASAVAGRSAQQLLVEALDALLAADPQVEALACQVPERQPHFSGEKDA